MVLEKGRGGSHEAVTVQAWKRSRGFHLPCCPVPRQHLICQTTPGRNVPLRISIQVISRLYMNSQLKNISLVAKAWKTKHPTHHSCAVWGQVPKGRRVYWQWMEKRSRAKTGVANRQVWNLFILRGLMFLYWGRILCVTLLSHIISFAFSPLSKILFVELIMFLAEWGSFSSPGTRALLYVLKVPGAGSQVGVFWVTPSHLSPVHVVASQASRQVTLMFNSSLCHCIQSPLSPPLSLSILFPSFPSSASGYIDPITSWSPLHQTSLFLHYPSQVLFQDLFPSQLLSCDVLQKGHILPWSGGKPEMGQGLFLLGRT